MVRSNEDTFRLRVIITDKICHTNNDDNTFIGQFPDWSKHVRT